MIKQPRKNKKAKTWRPNIPIATQLRLWVIAGGRCEYPGCSEYLLQDRLSLSEGNYANIAHIISWTHTGPRGDDELSSKLAKDISNLMLMCLNHAKKIDLKKNLPVYTVDYLKEAKKDHEHRIYVQTSIDLSRKTKVIRLQSNIRGRAVQISHDDAFSALIRGGRYPIDRVGVNIDLTNLDYSTDVSAWQTAQCHIDSKINSLLSAGMDGARDCHFSVFALAPIPILSYLGYKLGNVIEADIYIKLREKPWSYVSGTSNVNFTISRTNSESIEKKVAVSIAITGRTEPSEIANHFDSMVPFYELLIDSPSVDQIQCKEDLEKFRLVYRKLIDEIKERHGKTSVIHLFGALPACAAIICGRELLHGVDPPIIIYEHNYQEQGFIPVLTINKIQT